MLLALRLVRGRSELGDISLHQAPSLGLVQRGAQHRVDLADGGGREVALGEADVEAVEVEGGELRQASAAQCRLDLPFNVAPVVVERRLGTSEPYEMLQPAVEKLRQDHLVHADAAGGHLGLEMR